MQYIADRSISSTSSDDAGPIASARSTRIGITEHSTERECPKAVEDKRVLAFRC
jgi:hypothetical protein